MNWFAKNGDKVLSLLTVVLGLAVTQASALGLNPVAVAWIAFGSAVLSAAHTLYFPNTQVVAPSASSPAINVGSGKQGGFVQVRMMIALLCIGSAIAGCAALGLAQPTNSEESIAYGYAATSAAYTTLTQMSNQGQITKAQGLPALAAINAVKTSLDAAQAGVASSAPVAATVITTALASLTSVTSYLSCLQAKGASCQL